MAKVEKKFVITSVKGSMSPRRYETEPLTVAEAVKYFSYTLECGASYQHEKGNKKINRNPTTIKGLIANLNNAVNNSAANGYGGYHTFVEV